jgi:transposase
MLGVLTTPLEEEATVSNDIRERQWVGVDLHLRRSVICRIDEQGKQLDCVQINNDPKALVKAVRLAGRGAPVAVEATYGWYWAIEALQAARFQVHLAHPYGMKAMRKRKRVKTDARDAYELANLLRLGSLPEAYIAPAELRELRELVRHRRQLTKTATSVKAQIRALLAKHGVRLPASCLESQAGQDQLDAVTLPECAAGRLDSRRRLMMMLDNEIDALDVELDRRLKNHQDYRNLLKVKGIGPVLAAIFVVEIGDIHRFGTPEQLACWARDHPAALRVRPDRAARPCQQGRLRAGALGGGRSRATPVRTSGRQGARGHHRPARPAGPQRREGRRRPQDARGRLLRPARRPRPLPDHRALRAQGGVRIKTSCGPGNGMTHRAGAVE